MSQLPNEKKKRLQYNRANLQRAYDAVMSDGMSVYKASRVFNVPTQTLRDRTSGRVAVESKVGNGTVLTHDEEEALVQHLIYMADIGYGYTRMSIQRMAKEYAISLNKYPQTKQASSIQFSNNWFYSFLQRWPDLKVVKPQKLSIARAKNASPDNIKKYFKELSTLITQNNLSNKPHRIYNIDETGISTDHTPPKIVCGRETNPQSITSPRSSTVTIIAGGNAVGNYIPPLYVFPGKRWNPEFLSGAVPGSSGKMSESGWSNGAIFENYITEHFATNAGITDQPNQVPMLILYDGHRSHISLTLESWAKKRNVILFVLPPHSSHLTQPLDVGVFGPLKSIYNRECSIFMQRNPGISITKYDVAALTNKPYLKAMCPENLISAFKKTGIFPVNTKAITADQTAPSVIYTAVQSLETALEDDHTEQADIVIPEAHVNDNDNPHTLSTIQIDQNGNNSTDEIESMENNQTNNTPDSAQITADFFGKRTITSVSEKKKKRKFVPPLLAGNLSKKTNLVILESTKCKKPKPSEKTDLNEPLKIRKKPTFSSKVVKKSTCKPAKKSHKVCQEPQPSTSGLNIKGGPIQLDEDSQELSDMNYTDDEELCCVCDKWQPSELADLAGIVFVKWGKCDFCPHWTHLGFCTKVSVLRRGSVFRCPHCPEK